MFLFLGIPFRKHRDEKNENKECFIIFLHVLNTLQVLVDKVLKSKDLMSTK